MSKKIAILLFVPLVVLCAAQSVYIYQQRQLHQRILDPWVGIDRWMSAANKQLTSGIPVSFRDFDRLFDDRFFDSGFDPFRAIAGFPDQFDSLVQPQNRALFRNSLGDWFHSRMDVTSIRPEIKSTPDRIVVSFKIPHLQAQSIAVNVKGGRIQLSFSARNSNEKKDKDGNVIQQSESVQQFEKVLPVPADADPTTAVMRKSNDDLQILFKKNKTSNK